MFAKNYRLLELNIILVHNELHLRTPTNLLQYCQQALELI